MLPNKVWHKISFQELILERILDEHAKLIQFNVRMDFDTVADRQNI